MLTSTMAEESKEAGQSTFGKQHKQYILLRLNKGTHEKTYKHTDAAVLDLDVTEAVEALLVGILEEAEGIEEAKRGLGTEL